MLFSEKNIDPSTFFSSTSDWDWSVSEQKALKVVKLPNLNVFCLVSGDDIAPQSRRILQTYV